MKPILSIAGSDCSGGAGIQADIKTFSAHELFGMSVVCSVVAENTQTVLDYQDINIDIINKQIEAIFEDLRPEAVKIGMLSSKEIMNTVAIKLKEYQAKNIVVDPVMFAKNGSALMARDSIETLKAVILPIADLITPNIPEAEEIAQMKIENHKDMEKAAKIIINMKAKAVLIKGGHSKEDATDILYDGKNFYYYKAERINTKNTHGTGCTYSSAIASNLAKGLSLNEAVAQAKKYVTTAIKHSLNIGSGHGPTNHFYNLYQNQKKED
ncbi:bifunctional hydroxymethylpyrimidine kinase/phosphomethylpyrimidine kinase [Mycoplasma sp. P36-A1]|uniref:bifunctional hydroxymethylpyrimidine kinase/phosphomethylpyrimidine kinase n=1 Tax=Mycoplasma sp. P36-A1 TaxID=3252900 RepID=UPI003C2B90DE